MLAANILADGAPDALAVIGPIVMAPLLVAAALRLMDRRYASQAVVPILLPRDPANQQRGVPKWPMQMSDT